MRRLFRESNRFETLLYGATLICVLAAVLVLLGGCTTSKRLGRFLTLNEAHLEQAVHAQTFLLVPAAPQESPWH